MFHNSNGVDLHHFGSVRAWLENVRGDESFDNSCLAKRSASGCRICKMLEQTDDAVLNFDVGLGS